MTADPNRRAGLHPSGLALPTTQLSPEAARRDTVDDATFRRMAAEWSVATDLRPALVHDPDVDDIRRRISTGAGRLELLKSLAEARLAYYHNVNGRRPAAQLLPDQVADAIEFFGKYGRRLQGEPREAPANPLRKNEAQASGAGQARPAGGGLQAAATEPETTPARPPAAADQTARLEISFLSEDGFPCRLELFAPTGVRALELGAIARQKLLEQHAKPPVVNGPTTGAPAANAPTPPAAADDGPKSCKFHGAMKRSEKEPGSWYCSKKLPAGAGYCSIKWTSERGYFDSDVSQ